jgi:DNA-binding GntR family transcriptional regulator
MKHANEEDHQILELCRQRDVAAASRLLRKHILYAGESLKPALELKRTSAQVDSGDGNQPPKSRFP